MCEKYVPNPSIARHSDLHGWSRRRQKRCPEQFEVKGIEDREIAKMV